MNKKDNQRGTIILEIVALAFLFGFVYLYSKASLLIGS